MTRLDDEIGVVEARIARERALSREALENCKQDLRERATSSGSLAVLVVVGFAAGMLLRLRIARPAAGVLASIAAAFMRSFWRRSGKAGQLRLPAPGAAPAPTESYLAVDQARGGPT